MVYQGYGFGSYFGHARNRESECIAGGDRGNSWDNTNYGDVSYLLVTNAKEYLPSKQDNPGTPEFTPYTALVCSVLYVPSPTVLIRGNSTCPTRWTKLYSGYLLGGHYSHAGGSSNPICVDNENYDSTGGAVAAGGHYSYLHGSHTYDSTGVGSGYPNLRWLKCAVCFRQ